MSHERDYVWAARDADKAARTMLFAQKPRLNKTSGIWAMQTAGITEVMISPCHFTLRPGGGPIRVRLMPD